MGPIHERNYLDSELVKQLHRQAPVGIIATLMNSFILIFVLWKVIPHSTLIMWLSAIVLITLLRSFALFRYRHSSTAYSETIPWNVLFIIGMGLSGMIWGSAGIFLFSGDSVAHQVFLTFVLGGMVAGAAGTFSIVMKVFLAFSLPALIPVIVRLFVVGDEIHLAMGTMILFFGLLMFFTAKRVNEVTVSSIKLQYENNDLVDHLAAENERVEKLNKGLKSEITERKRMEDALRESEQKYRNIVENTLDVIMLTQPDGIISYMSPSCENVLGYNPADLTGKQPWIAHPEDLEKVKDIHCQALKGERGSSFEYRINTKAGETKWVSHSWSPILANDKLSLIVSGIRDITERKQAEMALLESEKKFRVALQSIPDSMTITRVKDGRYVYVNDGFCWMSGYSREEAIGKTPFDLNLIVDPDDRENFIKVLKEKGKIDGSELQYRMKDGTTIDTLLSARQLRYAEEDCLVAVVKDITAIKLAEQEKAGLEIRLQQAQKMEAIGTLAGGVAHDLNNILSGLVSYPDLLLMDIPEESPLRKPIQTIRKSGEKAAAIVQDLLTLARRGVVVSEVVNLNSIVTEYLASPEFEKLRYYHPQVQVETSLETDMMNISGSPVHLSKTLMNLVSNAAEAVPDGGGGRILLSTENRYIDSPIRGYDNVAEGDYVVFSISDTGIGISPEDMERIFEPFYTKKEMGRSGTGLGMAVVWGTVKDHRGYIDINSTEGKGSKFKLYFPVTREESKKDKSLISIEDYMGKGESILIVDDVEEQREIATGILKKLGYFVTSVSSGEEAVEYLKENTVDLIVLDMIMAPGIDGLETYKRILGLHPKQKTIIASGFSETDRVKEAQRLGAGAYVKKPYVLVKIGMAVRKELDL